MSKLFFIIISSFLFFNILFCNLARININQERIEKKIVFFDNKLEFSNKFKGGVIATGVVSAIGLISYLIVSKYFLLNSSSLSNNQINIQSNLNKIYERNDSYKSLINKDLWNFCKDGIAFATKKGVLLGVVGGIAGTFWVAWDSIKKKFMDCWKGEDNILFDFVCKNIELNLLQLNLFFSGQNIYFDKEEIADNMVIFVDSVEDLLAFVAVKLSKMDKENDSSLYSVVSESVIRLRNSAEIFLHELETALNKDNKKVIDSIALKNINNSSFELLEKQIVRFLGVLISVFYEKNKK